MWRDVSRPKLLRPPVFFFGSTRRFAGLHFVISPKPGSDLKRSVGVSGRKFFRAITKPDRFFLLLSASRSLFSNARSCSVFTSEAVASFTGLTLRADLNVV